MRLERKDLDILCQEFVSLHDQWLNRPPQVILRPHGGLSTQADLDIEEGFRFVLQRHFGPDISILGEEAVSDGNMQISRGPITALVDPIDGTRLYVEGEPGYACTFAIVDVRTLIGGCTYLPCSQERYGILPGHGIFRNGVCLSRPAGHPPRILAIRIADLEHGDRIRERLIDGGWRLERLGSTSARLISVSRGEIAGIVKRIGRTNGIPRVWGVSAGLIACDEMQIPIFVDRNQCILAVGDKDLMLQVNEHADMHLEQMDLGSAFLAIGGETLR